jgi:hypothetical protein
VKVGAVDIPEPDDDPALLAALYSGFAYAEHYRKVVLATCKELIRAGASLGNQKITEARLEDLARTHPSYLEFLTTHLHGRVRWEREVQKNGVGR